MTQPDGKTNSRTAAPPVGRITSLSAPARLVGARFSRACYLAALLSVATGCQPLYPNEPLWESSPRSEYRFESLELDEANTDELFICLTFSGGGTRAASLAYGVLLGLRELTIDAGSSSPPRRMLDEVDLISSVSGGSFTAAAYGLWREGVFDGRFEDRFLKKDVQGDLLARGLNPLNLNRTGSEIAARYYDENVFEGMTYQALIDRRTRPFIVINSTDVARQELFTFVQDDFDMLGSDLAKLPLAWAAAASSAYPILLGPLRLKYYSNDRMKDAVQRAVLPSSDRDRVLHPARRWWAESLLKSESLSRSGSIEIDEENHRYLYLLDGGLVDNLGLHSFFRSWRAGPIRDRIVSGGIRRVAVIMVDAGTKSESQIERSGRAPGTLGQIATTATAGLYTETWFSTAVAKYVFGEALAQLPQCYENAGVRTGGRVPRDDASWPADARVVYYIIDINLHSIADPALRGKLNDTPTNFGLPPERVDLLINTARQSVMTHPNMTRLLEDLVSDG